VNDLPLETLEKLAASNPDSFPVQMALGRALQKEKKTDEALAAYERAAALVPMLTGRDNPHLLIEAIALEKKDRARAIQALQSVVEHDFDNVEAARRLASLLREAGVTDPAALRPVYERIVAIDPYDADAHTRVGRFALERMDYDVAAREFRVVLALKPVDRAAALTDLADAYLRGGKTAEAKKQTIAALEIAPGYERAQELLLKLAVPR
jgi:Tfp pilus assembly protein PilF